MDLKWGTRVLYLMFSNNKKLISALEHPEVVDEKIKELALNWLAGPCLQAPLSFLESVPLRISAKERPRNIPANSSSLIPSSTIC